MDDVYLGNGVSELIVMSLQALLDDGDEVLIPSPDYPLWTAAVSLAGGATRALPLRRERGLAARPGRPRGQDRPTAPEAIVVINPNNPTGAVYGQPVLEGMVELARSHGLVLFSDEIYDQILYDDAATSPPPRSPRTCSA